MAHATAGSSEEGASGRDRRQHDTIEGRGSATWSEPGMAVAAVHTGKGDDVGKVSEHGKREKEEVAGHMKTLTFGGWGRGRRK